MSILVQPSPDQLSQALRAVPGRGGLVSPEELAGVFDSGPAGWSAGRFWGTTPGATTFEGLEYIWWTDHLGRKHVRLTGENGLRISLRLLSLPASAAGVTGLALVMLYPDRVFLRGEGAREEVLVLCPCGAAGPPERLGWVGQCCGPCHDRVELEGAAPAAADTLSKTEFAPSRIAFSPDGQLLSWLSGRTWGETADVRAGGPPARFELTGASEPWFGFTADGQGLLYLHGDSVWTVPVRGGPHRLLTRLADLARRNRGPDPIAAGPVFATVVEQSVLLWDMGRKGRDRVAFVGSWLDGRVVLALGKGGKLLALADQNQGLQVWDTARRRRLGGMPLPGPVDALAFSPDARTLAVALSGQGILLCDAARWKETTRLEGPKAGLEALSFARGGSALVALDRDAGLVRAWALDTGAQRPPVRPGAVAVQRLAVSPDGTLLAFIDRQWRVRVWPADVLWQ
jgi:hypothetical protein